MILLLDLSMYFPRWE